MLINQILLVMMATQDSQFNISTLTRFRRLCNLDSIEKMTENRTSVVIDWNDIEFKHAIGMNSEWEIESSSGHTSPRLLGTLGGGNTWGWRYWRGVHSLEIRCFIADNNNDEAKERFIYSAMNRSNQPIWKVKISDLDNVLVAANHLGMKDDEALWWYKNLCISIHTNAPDIDTTDIAHWLYRILQSKTEPDIIKHRPDPQKLVTQLKKVAVNTNFEFGILPSVPQAGSNYSVRIISNSRGMNMDPRGNSHFIGKSSSPGKAYIEYMIINRKTLLSVRSRMEFEVE